MHFSLISLEQEVNLGGLEENHHHFPRKNIGVFPHTYQTQLDDTTQQLSLMRKERHISSINWIKYFLKIYSTFQKRLLWRCHITVGQVGK